MHGQALVRWLLFFTLLTIGCGPVSSGGGDGSPDEPVGAAPNRPPGAAPSGTIDDAPDAGPVDGGAGGEADAGVVRPTGWLYTSGNRIYQSDGTVWRGRGANLHDTRSCNACTYSSPNPAEVKRRIDEVVDVWKANFLRLDLESYGSSGGRAHWRGVVEDPAYLADLRDIVAHIGRKPGVYVMLSLWIDPTFDSMGAPTQATLPVLRKLAETFKHDPHVLFGVSNEPQSNYDGARDAAVWSAMNAAVQAIRDVESAAGTPHHVVSVQGTGGWARFLDYYVTRPIAAGGGKNVAYEVHVYDPASTFAARFVNPSRTLPVIIGEFGPAHGMSLSDCLTLIAQAKQRDIAFLAWTFHMRCPPNLLVDDSGGGCGVSMPLRPTAWGSALKAELARP